MSGKKTAKKPDVRRVNPNPLRDIRHANGFHMRIADKPKQNDDDCPSCGDNFYNCICFLDKEEELDDG